MQFVSLFLEEHNVNVVLTGEIALVPRNIIPSIYLGLRYNIALSKYFTLLQYVSYIFMGLNEKKSENCLCLNQ